MTEAELCLKLEDYHQGYEIYKEVPTSGGRLDMYVKKGPLWVAIEVKKTFSTRLIYQAMRNQPHAHYSFIAFPATNNDDGSQRAICKALGIGVLIWENRPGMVHGWGVKLHPVYRRNITPLRVLPKMKNAVAGVQHNTMSDYKITVSLIALFLHRHGGRALVADIFKDNKYHYCSTVSAKQCILKIAGLGNIPEFSIEGKELVLSKNWVKDDGFV